MFEKSTSLVTLLLTFSLSYSLTGCNLLQKLGTSNSEATDVVVSSESVCKRLTWRKVKNGLKDENLTNESIENLTSYITNCEIKPRNINYLIDIFRSTENNILQKKILEVLNYVPLESNENILSLYQDVARNSAPFLSKTAVQTLAQAGRMDELLDIYESRDDAEIRQEILHSISWSFPKITRE